MQRLEVLNRWFTHLSRQRQRPLAGLVAAGFAISAAVAYGHPPADPLHGGQGRGVAVVGHSDLGGRGLNGHVAVLGNYAFVGFGTNGGFASQWNKTPTCRDAGPADAGAVKVVSLTDPANPTVVGTISPTAFDPTAAAEKTLARDVAAIHMSTPFFTGDLLAVALESCNAGSEGFVGVNFYDVTNPASPALLGRDDRFLGNSATRQVSLVQRPDGRVFSLEANQGGLAGGIHVVDVTNPRSPLPIGTFDDANGGASTRECRPFSFAQGVVSNSAGSKAYAAYQDQGLFVLDISNPVPAAQLPVLSQAQYAAGEEGNSFRFLPNATEKVALATDEDLLPAKTTLSIAAGSAAGRYRGCEAIWGGPAPTSGPLYRSTTPTLGDRQIVLVGGRPGQPGEQGCFPTDYSGLDVANKFVLTYRGVCNFEQKAVLAQERNAVALLVANTIADHHGGGTGVLFSPDSAGTVDAGISIPVVMITQEAGNAISTATQTETVTGTLTDAADTWGALRIFSLSGASPAQVGTFNAPHTNVLTPGDGLYHAVNALWEGDQALVAWMSDGLRVVDLRTANAPKGRAFYVPPGVNDPTLNYAPVPLVVSVAKFGSRYVITDINGGLYVLNVVLNKDQCLNRGWQQFGFMNQGECVNLFDDDPPA